MKTDRGRQTEEDRQVKTEEDRQVKTDEDRQMKTEEDSQGRKTAKGRQTREDGRGQMDRGRARESSGRTYQGAGVAVGDEIVQQHRHVCRLLLQETDVGEEPCVARLKPHNPLVTYIHTLTLSMCARYIFPPPTTPQYKRQRHCMNL